MRQMSKLKKNKKGEISYAGWSVILGIVIVLVSFLLLTRGTIYAASKLEDIQQISLCRKSNELKVGTQKATDDILAGPSICTTIDKTKRGSQVPSEKYFQGAGGASKEIGDMITNCWYMWLEGTKTNMFNDLPGTNSCFMCYLFKVKNKPGLSQSHWDIVRPMSNQVYIAEDISDKCGVDGGGYFRAVCEEDEIEIISRRIGAGKDERCCVKNIGNECENRGGLCVAPGGFTGDLINTHTLYEGWSCPPQKRLCLVREDKSYTYEEYITDFEGSFGGSVHVIFTSKKRGTPTLEFEEGGLYAVSFVSPSEQFKGSFLRSSWIQAVMPEPFKGVSSRIIGGVLSPITEEKASFILLSTLEDAQQKLKCTFEGG